MLPQLVLVRDKCSRRLADGAVTAGYRAGAPLEPPERSVIAPLD
ncbi:MAG TPA: hypothetical protein VK866_07160 [Acidimicrobiales bacterium]|nr:hypothetical protein [Acidimicrobiales bacterium]